MGRLVDDEGRGVAFTKLSGKLTPDEQAKFRDGAAGSFFGGHFRATTDKDGYFEIEGLLPGRNYHIRNLTRSADQLVFVPREALVKFPWSVPSGETLDLGDILVSDAP